MPRSSRPGPGEAGRDRSRRVTLAAAVGYARRGRSVISLVAGEKRPTVPWYPCQHEIASMDENTGWFRRYPHTNLGIVTGTTSGRIVLDVDPRHGGDQALAALERRHGQFAAHH